MNPITILAFAALIAANTRQQSQPIRIDGTGRMGKISKALFEAAKKANFTISISDRESGTTGGFAKFAVGRHDINKAAVRMKDKLLKECLKNGISFTVVPIGHSRGGVENLNFYVTDRSLQRDEVCGLLKFCLSDAGQELAAKHGKPLTKVELAGARASLIAAIKDVRKAAPKQARERTQTQPH